jgi:CHAT domain-containing protein/Tfp pilus assembly protein PilF
VEFLTNKNLNVRLGKPVKIGRRKIIVGSFFIIGFVALFLTSCGSIQRNRIGVENEKAVQLINKTAKLYDRGKYQEALETLSNAEKEASLREDKLKIAEILFKGGFALQEKKLFETALSYYEHSLEINKKLANNPGLINDYSYIGKTYTDLGKYEEGIKSFEDALKIQQEINDKAGTAHNLNNVANLYSYLGDYHESIRLLNQALSISKGIRDSTQTAKTLVNLGTIYLRLRNYEKSIAYLEQAIRVSDESKEEAQKAIALNLVGVVYRYQGNYDKALENYQRALEINRKLDLKTEVATNLSILGELYKELGQYSEAQKYLQQSLEMSETLNDRLLTGVNLNYLGEVSYKQENYRQASDLYNSSLAIFQELGFKDRIARSYSDISYLEGAMGQTEQAIQTFDKAIQIYKDLGDREWIRIALYGKAVYLEDEGDLQNAEKNYKEAVDVFESIREDVVGGEEARQLFSDVNVDMYEKLVSLLLRLGKKDEALKYIERSRSKTLRDAFLKSGIDSHDEKTRGLLRQFDELFRKENSINYELTKERSKPFPNLEKVDTLVKTLAKTRKEFNQVSLQLGKQYPQLYNFLSIKPDTILDLKQKGDLPKDTLFVEYFVTNKETYIFVISNNDLIVKSVPVSKDELNELVVRFRDLIENNKIVATNAWRDDRSSIYSENIEPFKDISVRLYHYLIKPIDDDIRDSQLIAIIPFGALNYLPFNALARESSDGDLDFLIEEKEIVYLVSSSPNYLEKILSESHHKEITSVVAFGNPDLGEPELALPYSEQEVLAIKQMFPNAITYLEKKATKAKFESVWGNPEIIHLAAHGLIQQEPSILLAPIGAGTLTLTDIMGLPPSSNTSLVVLSVCNAAIDRNEVNPTGEELNSIAMAFTWVGVPSVIATLWEVNDELTSELMESFYKNLKDRGKFDYEALRRAQLDLISRSDKYGQPFYWAPFILIGLWG